MERLTLRVDALNVLRLWLVFLSFFPMPLFVLAVVQRVKDERRAIAIAGGVFFLIFIFVELLYRSVELLTVVGVWVPTLLAETDPTRRLLLETRITAFDQAVHALYYVLLGSQLLGSLLFAAAVRGRSRWELAVAVMFGVNAGRLLLRMLEGYAGITALQPVNAALYTPLVTTFFLIVAAWLSRTRPRSGA